MEELTLQGRRGAGLDAFENVYASSAFGKRALASYPPSEMLARLALFDGFVQLHVNGAEVDRENLRAIHEYLVAASLDEDEAVVRSALSTLGKWGLDSDVPVVMRVVLDATEKSSEETVRSGIVALAMMCGTAAGAAMDKIIAGSLGKQRAEFAVKASSSMKKSNQSAEWCTERQAKQMTR